MKVVATAAGVMAAALLALVVTVKLQALWTALATEGTAAHAVVMKRLASFRVKLAQMDARPL